MDTMQRLASRPVHNADLLEMMRRGTADILYDTEGALLLHDRESDVVALCAQTEHEARAALEHFPRTGIYLAHGEMCARLLQSATGCEGVQKCRQARYMATLPPAEPDVELRVLDERYTDIVFENYHLASNRDYVAARVRAGAMLGAFCGGVLAGFIGTHDEGSIGMLEVFPAYRRRGVGYALEAGAIRRAMAEGRIPYCHVIDGNERSMRLQEKLCMDFSDDFVYWIF